MLARKSPLTSGHVSQACARAPVGMSIVAVVGLQDIRTVLLHAAAPSAKRQIHIQAL